MLFSLIINLELPKQLVSLSSWLRHILRDDVLSHISEYDMSFYRRNEKFKPKSTSVSRTQYHLPTIKWTCRESHPRLLRAREAFYY